MKIQHEVEATYALADDTVVPDLLLLDGVQEVRQQPAFSLTAAYFDTADLALLRSGVSLRRRTGGVADGWHLKVPAGGGRDEFHRPLGRSTATPPKPLRDLVAGWVRGEPLVHVATVHTDRTPSLLLGADGLVLAELTDDRVTGSTPEGETVAWREWELELVDGTADLFDSADQVFAAAGVHRAEVSRKVARTLGDRVPPAPRLWMPAADEPVSRLVHARLVEQVDVLGRRDVDARRGTDEGVHKMRVACRRLRALLGSFRPVLDREQTDPVRDELRWLAGVLGQARDAAAIHGRLRDLLADEPRDLVHGPVLGRLRSVYEGRGKDEVLAALGSQRYFDLRDRLDQLAADPPWTERAEASARDVAPKVLHKEFKRFRRRADAAAADEPEPALHEARKAAKRLRYAAETVEPVAGKKARRLDRAAHHVTSHLGELQDTTVSRSELLAVAQVASEAGEPTFAYGRLHALDEARASTLIAAFRVRATVARLKARTRKARKALRRT
ncbi:CYTH and CHAD domain-containing protein [Mumia zhuanghuii]|uniref:CHAD domain-containing protein n=2 Tax=Mumia TaxID=1546255 RepID=A0ABW1QIE3_9ACTN|nr:MULTISPECIES: CYTH and CHAD domain-containing protein [Mumia]KAA1422697.1 CYTH and CHAD domain-containing protein [Mumia zhuanghuii]